MNQIRLSPSKLNEFNACPKCFYDAYALGIKKPRGIFPSLPGGMDRVLKKHFDKHRGSMPPEIKGRIDGVLMKDQALINRWRNWRTGMTYKDSENDIVLIGAIDDCVFDWNASTLTSWHIPLDYKTKGAEPQDSGVQYYQTQLDCYNLMLSSAGYKTKEMGYLVYFYPSIASGLYQRDGNGKISARTQDIVDVRFGISVFRIPCNIERAKEVIAKAAECLRGKRPEPSNACEHCQHILSHIAKEREETQHEDRKIS